MQLWKQLLSSLRERDDKQNLDEGFGFMLSRASVHKYLAWIPQDRLQSCFYLFAWS